MNRKEALVSAIQEQFPKFRVVDKTRSTFMKFLYFVSFMKLWNPNFLNDYLTTIGNTVYAPYAYITWPELAHEYVHIYDYNTRGAIKFNLQYLFPQVLAALSLLSILAIFNLWFLLFLLFLVFLAPLPAPWREELELRGYATNVAIPILVNSVFDPTLMILEEFTGMTYYKMSWTPEKIKRILKDYQKLAKEGSLWLQQPYATILMSQLDLKRVKK